MHRQRSWKLITGLLLWFVWKASSITNLSKCSIQVFDMIHRKPMINQIYKANCRNSRQPQGEYPCCGAKAFRFAPIQVSFFEKMEHLSQVTLYIKSNDGCQFCEHSVTPKTKEERDILHIMFSLRFLCFSMGKDNF